MEALLSTQVLVTERKLIWESTKDQFQQQESKKVPKF